LTNDILNVKPGELVKFENPEDGYEIDRDLAKRNLEVGAVYKVTAIQVGGFNSVVWLEDFEFPFNTVLFEPLDFSEVPPVDQQVELNQRINAISSGNSDFNGVGAKTVHTPSNDTPVSNNATTPRNKATTEQTVGTDPVFWDILDGHFGFTWDLACNYDNCLVRDNTGDPMGYYFPDRDALKESWHIFGGWFYLNPPYKDCKIWAAKCALEMERGAKIVMLTPASVGSNWFKDSVYKKASVRLLNGRLTFKGHKTPYPKDCMISIFQKHIYRGIDVWDWRKGWN